MFGSLDSNRLQEERAIWQRAQKHGKLPFILSRTLSIGGVLSLFIYPVRRSYVPGSSHGRTIFLLSYIVCLSCGYLTSEFAWRRGLRLTHQAPEPEH
jgi:hypothetical protein